MQQTKSVPSDSTPICLVPIANLVTLPSVKSVIKLGLADYKKVDEYLSTGNPWIVAVSVHSAGGQEGPKKMSIGTLCKAVTRIHDGTIGAVHVEGLSRVRLTSGGSTLGNLVTVSFMPDKTTGGSENPNIISEITIKLNEIIKITSTMKSAAPLKFSPSTSPEAVGWIVAAALQALPANIGVGPAETQKILEEQDLAKRLGQVSNLVSRCVESARLVQEVNESIVKKHNVEMRKHLIKRQIGELQNQLKTLEPLNEGGTDEDEIASLKRRLSSLPIPAEVERIVKKEFKRLETLQQHHPEFPGIISYLETVASLPWAAAVHDPNPGAPSLPLIEDHSAVLSAAKFELDKHHYGLEKVKKRLVEFLAVQLLSVQTTPSVLCLHGGPGVGKSSIAESIAQSMNRKFVRISLSGVRDESELRGHRKTYIGSMAGLVIQSLIRAGVSNPVILLDEIDKIGFGGSSHQMGRGHHGAANVLLELLDPEQNTAFRDAYLNFGFDLSKCLFICTCNDLGEVSRPLLDRLEVVTIPGYSEHEKVEICKRHLLSRAVRLNGLDSKNVALELSDEAVKFLIHQYTHENGVRGLTRRVNDICRHFALALVDGSLESDTAIFISSGADIIKILGPGLSEGPLIPSVLPVGVSLGLAVSSVGGDVLFIESVVTGRSVSGNGQTTITGQLGDVMKESVRAALSLLMNRSLNRGLSASDSVYASIDPVAVKQSDIHVHFPTGAVQKNGPSAGVSTSIALASLFSGRSARSDLASTGEITLRGDVLPIGGVKEKILAAHRAGLRMVLLPAGNSQSLQPGDLPPQVTRELEIRYARTIDEVLAVAFASQPFEKRTDTFNAAL